MFRKNTVVLEISTTLIFLLSNCGLAKIGTRRQTQADKHRKREKVIQWNRNSEYVENELTNKFEIIDQGDGWIEEKTGLHKTQFIETRSTRFPNLVLHSTHESVNVLNL